MNDYRLYYYTCGTLHKHNSRYHKFKTIEDCDTYINQLRTIVPKYSFTNKPDLYTQYVLVQYFEAYNSVIIKLYNPISNE